ncbi:Flp pilus assembly pilin Flp [Aeromicrobium sp. SORGH_AS981]|nr:Flp family type IVb pilin [Aeromicrobium sp. SORGH_AS_0981]MDR6120398.1 Flp pilus assembly pilin Flp [Aeromicrobium sp. SORGH_AS_0981]
MTHDERGATAVEYALLAASIAAVIAVAVGIFGQDVLELFERVPPF